MKYINTALSYFNYGKKDKVLGVSEKRTYDIPLDRDSGQLFLSAITGLMVFLMILSVSAAYILNSFAYNWQTGLEGKWTIEIPVIDDRGENLDKEEIEDISSEVLEKLATFHAIQSTERLSDETIKELLSPWFGEGNQEAVADEDVFLPIPVLITLDMKETGRRTAHEIRMEMEQISPLIRLDRHESWLGELLQMTGTLRFVALLITLVICTAGILAVAGAMQSRMAEHRDSVELLHLMGAGDKYISRQFQRHALIISSQGATAGLLVSVIFVHILQWFLSGSNEGLLPSFSPTPVFWLLFLLVPCVTIILCVMTTKWAVLQRLQKML